MARNTNIIKIERILKMMKSDFLRMRKLYLKPNAIKAYLKPCLCSSKSYNIDNTNN